MVYRTKNMRLRWNEGLSPSFSWAKRQGHLRTWLLDRCLGTWFSKHTTCTDQENCPLVWSSLRVTSGSVYDRSYPPTNITYFAGECGFNDRFSSRNIHILMVLCVEIGGAPGPTNYDHSLVREYVLGTRYFLCRHTPIYPLIVGDFGR